MALTAGIVGLPNVGKSTLFNAITKSQVEAANYPFATIAPNVGVVKVNDPRLDTIQKFIESKKIIPTTFEFTDIAGLVKGASKGEGLGNQFLSNIREVDAIVHVVRCFANSDIVHEHGIVGDPISDIEIIEIELMLADLQSVENRISRVGRKAKSNDKEAMAEMKLLDRAKETLENNRPLSDLNLNEDDEKLARTFHFLTIKPVIYVANIDEDSLMDIDGNEMYQKVKAYAEARSCRVIPVCAKVEEDLSSLEDDEKAAFLSDLGVQESGLDVLVRNIYEILNLRTFFTAGPQEIRAWTFVNGMKAPQCAGVIHTDFEKGFIRSETYNVEDLEAYGSEQAIKEAGKMRSEGKEYVMKDGDIVHFRFNN
ncbi:redox-regulated ATPase YchF [Erysipelothrix rhusiopathiae]|uniref:redox-regulated ATPase YchF n=1 Tax=Erysipelothrix rhusiopathiae TaxID=1648 RepID=UPI002B2515B7|nr:redox-regulated ATPase YchF [Erysipelothrix rhusiopathiae]WRB93286.1 redox-regulated ATPase YchF [Erysipelothrix rhusiopathiae]